MTEDIKGVGEAHLLDTLVDDMDILLGKGSCGAVYSLKSSPTDVVKEIQLDGVPPTRLESLREDVNHFLHLDHPRVIKYQRVVWREGLLYIFMKRYSQSLDSVIKIYKRKILTYLLKSHSISPVNLLLPWHIFTAQTRQVRKMAPYPLCSTRI